MCFLFYCENNLEAYGNTVKISGNIFVLAQYNFLRTVLNIFIIICQQTVNLQ